MLPITPPSAFQVPLNDLTLIPKFVEVLNTLDEEKIIHYLNTYGINATSEKFPEDGYSKRLIHIAATKGWATLIHNLILSGEQFDVGAEAQDGTYDLDATPFAFAALNGHFDTMELLLEQGASLKQSLPEFINRQRNLQFIQSAKEVFGLSLESLNKCKETIGEFMIMCYTGAPEKWPLDLVVKYYPTIFLNPPSKLSYEIFLSGIKISPLVQSSLISYEEVIMEFSSINCGELLLINSQTYIEKYQIELLHSLFKARFPVDIHFYIKFLGDKINEDKIEIIFPKCSDINVKILNSENSGQNCYELAIKGKEGKISSLARKILEIGGGFGEILISQKLLLLRFGIKVSVQVENRTITFDGYNNWITYPEVFNSLTSFFKAHPNIINQQSIDSILGTYWQHVHGNNQKEINEAISLEKQVIIDSGWKGNGEEAGHAITVLIYKNLLCVANRGAGALEGEEGLIFYEMDEEVKISEIIELLLAKTQETKDFLSNLKNKIDFTRLISLKHKTQPIGNCTWVSPKTITRACFLNVFLEQGKELKEAVELSRTLYNEWVAFDKIFGLNRFLNDPYHKNSKKQNEDEGIIFDRVVQECLLHAPKGLKEVLFKQLIEYFDPLQQALFLKDPQKALQIIESADFSFQLESKTTLSALHLAAFFGQQEIIQALLKKEMCHLSVNKIKPSPIEIAFLKNHFEIVKQLLPFYTEIDVLDDKKMNLLSLSCKILAIDIIKLLIELNADCNIPNEDGVTPFYSVCLQSAETVEALEKRRAACLLLLPKVDLNIISKDGWGILHFAVFSKDVKIVEFVLNAMKENKCDLDLLSLGGNTPLLLALNATVPSSEIVKMLIDSGCNVNSTTPSKTSAISLATIENLDDVIQLMIDKGANLSWANNDGWTALHFAAMHKESTLRIIIKAMQQQGIDLNPITPGGFTPLLLALKREVSLNNIRQLIDAGCDLNAQDEEEGLTPFHYLCMNYKNSETEILEQRSTIGLMMLPKINLSMTSKDGWGILHYAVFSKDIKIVESVLNLMKKNNCDLDLATPEGTTPLLLAINAKVFSCEIIKMLINAGCNVNAGISSKTTALSVAIDKSMEEIVPLLLEKGAVLPFVDEDEWSLLHIAVLLPNDQIVRALIKAMKQRGLDLNPVTPGGHSPLLLAINCNGSFSKIKLLIESGANLNAQTSLKKSALSCAVIENREDVVQLLLDNDADLTSMDESGWTAYDYACYFENEIIINSIKTAMLLNIMIQENMVSLLNEALKKRQQM